MGKHVDGLKIQVLQIEEDDYISLTDMVRKILNSQFGGIYWRYL